MTTESILYVEAGLSDLAEIRSHAKNVLLKIGGTNEAVSEIVLAVNEAVTNIIVHGYGRNSGFLEIVIRRDGADIIVILRDNAPPFDPNTFPPPDITLPLEQRKPGGMGIHMMRNFVDEMNYRKAAEDVNELVLVKRFAASGSKTETES